MAEPKLDLKGVIQVKDGPGWSPLDPKVVFQPIMDAINAIRRVDPDIYIGLIYGANAGQSKIMFDLYGFSNANPPSTGKITVDIAKTIGTLTSEKILTFSGKGQAAVLSSDIVVKDMLKDITNFIIIPFDTVNSKPKKDKTGADIANGTDDYASYGHRDDCLAFAEKFLALPKSIIIGWQPMVSEFTIPIETDSDGLKAIKQGPAAESEFKNLYFALGAGVAGHLEPTAISYIDFLIQKWDKESQEFINSKLSKGAITKKNDDDADAEGPEKKTPGVTEEKKNALKTRLAETKSKLQATATLAATPVAAETVAATPVATPVAPAPASADRAAAYGIAQEIFNAFFGGSDDKSKQTKPFLTEKVAALKGLTIFSKEQSKASLDAIGKRLENPAAAATSTVGRKPLTRPVPVVTPEKKYVFAFDIDNTLVQGSILDSKGMRTPFNAATHAADYTAMLNLMKKIIDAKHYVWIVTANTKIIKATFEYNYLTGETGKEITSSPNYYFMNPATVADELKSQFVDSQISPLTDTTTTPLDLGFDSEGDGSDFQAKGLKPYAMIAKWLELKNTTMDDVQMYLFDDNESRYEKTCKNVKDNKIEFVKIGPPALAPTTPVAPAPAPPSPPAPAPALPPLSGFKSDVLTKATEKFNAIPKTTKTPVTSGLNVMTFNTWYEALGNSPSQKFCTDGANNKCQDNIRAAILAQMDKPGPVVIFLQEFTYNFEEFFGSDIQITNKILESNCGVLIPKGSKSTPSTKAFRHFTMTYKTRPFYVYTGQIGNSVMTTIYSSDLCNESATYFLMGNLASGMNPGGDTSNHEIVPTFSGFATITNITEDVRGIQGGNVKTYNFTGGDRPFMVLRFDDPALQLILLNIHAPKEVAFNKPKGKLDTAPNKTVARFAFDAIGPFFDKEIFTGTVRKQRTDYRIVAGGDFNTDANNALAGLKAVLTDTNKSSKRDGKTCCTTNGGVKFSTAVDHIFSTVPITDYTVHDTTTTPKTTSNPRYLFSDHLPVYATITLPPIASAVP